MPASDTGPAALAAGSSYGSDPSGLICGFAFRAGQVATSLASEQVEEWLRRPREGSGDFAWLHLSLASAHAEAWMRRTLALPDEYYEALRSPTRSTRIEQVEDCLVAVVNDVLYDFTDDGSQIATLWVCARPGLVVSARLHSLRSIDRLRASVRSGECIDSPVALLAHLLRDQADVLQGIERDATVRVDRIEDGLLAGATAPARGTLGSLRRVLIRLSRLLAPEPGALFRLLNRPPSWLSVDDLQQLRTATEEFSAVLNDFAGLQERTKLLQEEIVAMDAERTSRSVVLLTMVTVMALPINIVAGLFGMNVGGIPFSEDSTGFPTIVSLVLVFTCAAAVYVWRRRND